MQCSVGPRGESLIMQCRSPRFSNGCAEMSRLSKATIGNRDSTALPVMPVPINRVLAVGDLLPDGVGDEFVLRACRPVVMPRRVPRMHPHDFLKEQDVDGEPVQALAQLVDDHPPIELREPLVDVVRCDGEVHGRTGPADKS